MVSLLMHICVTRPQWVEHCITEHSMNLCQFLLAGISSLYIPINSLWICTGMCCLAAVIQNAATRGAMMVYIVSDNTVSYWFLSIPSGSHCIITQLYWFSITTLLLHIVSYCHNIVLYGIPLYCIRSSVICVYFNSYWFVNNHHITLF